MKNSQVFLSCIICVLILFACYKRKPPKGNYEALFEYSSEIKPDTIIHYKILESNGKWIILSDGLDNDTLIRQSRKIVRGKLFSSTIIGNVARNKSSNRFMILGTFVQKLTPSGPGSAEFTGTFTLK